MLSELHSVLNLLEGGFGQLRILVIGDLMLDRYILGDVDRISPEAPVPVLRHARRYERPGGAANVAMNLAGLGCQTFLAGFWGSDPERAELGRLLDSAGIDTLGVVSSSLQTTSKTRIVGRTQQMLRIDIESRELPPPAEAQRLLERAVELTGKVNVVILSDYAKGALSRDLCEAVIRTARAASIPVFVDPKTRDFSKYTGATAVCPNLNELSIATGVAKDDKAGLLAASQAMLTEHDFDFIAVTRSADGIDILSREGNYHSPAQDREVYDVSGAGDTAIATIAAALAGGLRRETAVDLANIAAGIVVGKVGTVPVSRGELISALTPSPDVSAADKILDRHRLQLRVAEWRASGESIVFTNGCFDLLHVGHVTLLEESRRFGSKLVVGLNTDASVSRLKGLDRPIVGERERARILSAFSAVDAIVLFEEDTPLALIQQIEPDVLVKGGDYVVESVVGHREVLARGGRVEIVPTVEGFSTTGLIRKIGGKE